MPSYPPYAESTKQRIVDYVLRNPGHTGGEIASALGLDKSRVNSFLYSEGRQRSACRTTTGNGAQLALLLDTVAPRAGHRFMSLQFLHQGDLGKGSRLLLLSVDH